MDEQVLSISVKLNIDQAKQALADLKKQVDDTEKKAGGKSGKSKSSSKSKRDTDKAQKATSEQTKANGKLFAGIAKSLGAMMAFGKIISSLNNLMKKGEENLYEYSKLTGGNLSKAMDSITSAKESFANSLGALKSNFTMALEPFITSFFQKMTEIINKVSKVIAELFGLPQYFQANDDIFIQWQANLKESRALIGGFDKLQVFSGSRNTMPRDMFTTVKNENAETTGIKGFINEFKTQFGTIFSNIGTSFRNILEAILGKDLVDAILNLDFKKIGEELNKIVKEFGLDELFTSFKNTFQSVTDLIKDITESQWFKSAIDMIKSILKLFSGVTKTALDFISDLIQWFRGTKTWSDVMDNLASNFTSAIVGPAKEAWEKIKVFFVDILDAVYVWFYNKTHVVDIEHSGFWYDYHPEVRTALLMAMNEENKKNKTSPYATPDYSSYTDADWKKELDKWYNQGFTGIPKKASGGVFSTPSLIQVGEYSGAKHNPELVTPTDLLDSRLQANNRDMLSAIYDMNRELISAISGINMEVKIGEDVLARATARGADSYYRMTGKALIK